MEKKGSKKRSRRVAEKGIAHIQSTFNNTIITLSDMSGNVITWASAGTQGFKGARKSTPFAAQRAAESAARKARDLGLKKLCVEVEGPGSGSEAGKRDLKAAGMKISIRKDVTAIPHNGCRPPKRRRF